MMNMNKYKEALDRFWEAQDENHCLGYSRSLLQELVEKATPINPTITGDSFDDYYICPICGNLVNYMQKYCDNCGQKLLWLKSDGK